MPLELPPPAPPAPPVVEVLLIVLPSPTLKPLPPLPPLPPGLVLLLLAPPAPPAPPVVVALLTRIAVADVETVAAVTAVAAEAASDEPSTTRASGPAGSGRGVGDDRIVGCASCIPATITIAANYVADAAAAGRAAAYCTGQGNCDVAAPADADAAVAAVADQIEDAADRSASQLRLRHLLLQTP